MPTGIITILVILAGLVGACFLGNSIANENWSQLILITATIFMLLLNFMMRESWWVVIPVAGALGFSTPAFGFNLSGVDIGLALALVIIIFRVASHTVQPAQPPMRMSWIFHALCLYVLIHAIVAIIYNHLSGDTQVKNVVKAYFEAVAPLLVLRYLSIYAKPSGVKLAIGGVLLISTVAFSVGCAVVYLQTAIPLLSNGFFDFQWAGGDVLGYIRWSSYTLLLLALCLSTATRSGILKCALYLIAVLALGGAFFGGGRVAFAACLIAFVLWLILRRSLILLALGCTAILGVFGIINVYPDLLQELPSMVQRSFTPFVLSESQTDEELVTKGSDKWHEDLKTDSWTYWMESPLSIVVGHGYKGWNDAIDIKTFTSGPLYDEAKKIAVQMGRTENLFSSILVIFGAVGLLLYYGFMIFLAVRLWRLRNASPQVSLARSMCEFSLCLIVVAIIIAYEGGNLPDYKMIYWFFGLLVTREYIPIVSQQEIPCQPATSISEDAADVS